MSKIKEAIQKGMRERALQKAQEAQARTDKQREAADKLEQQTQQNVAFLLKDDYIYRLVESAVSKGQRYFVLYWSEPMEQAIRRIKGFSCYKTTESNPNYEYRHHDVVLHVHWDSNVSERQTVARSVLPT